MKRLALGVVIVAMLLSGCSPLNDEIELVSPEDGAILNVNNLRADTTFGQDGIHIVSIYYKAPFRWKDNGLFDQDYYILEFSDQPKYGDTVRFNIWISLMVSPEETEHEFMVVLARADGYMDEDSHFILDTTIIYSPFTYWRVSTYLVETDEADEYTYSETWSFTVVKD